MEIKTKYNIGDIVYIKTDSEQKEYFVVGICIRYNNTTSYNLVNNTSDTWHYEFEINKERDIVKATTN